jgi:hypothetical protein
MSVRYSSDRSLSSFSGAKKRLYRDSSLSRSKAAIMRPRSPERSGRSSATRPSLKLAWVAAVTVASYPAGRGIPYPGVFEGAPLLSAMRIPEGSAQ